MTLARAHGMVFVALSNTNHRMREKVCFPIINLATVLSGGLSTADISKREAEYGVSQVFIAIDTLRLQNHQTQKEVVRDIILDYHTFTPASSNSGVCLLGESSLKNRKVNLKRGIPGTSRVKKETGKF